MNNTNNTNRNKMFNKIANHLLTQNERSSVLIRTNTGRVVDDCKYRLMKDGKLLMCAVGCLIDEQYYNDGIESFGIIMPEVYEVLKKSGIDLDDTNIRLLKKLQCMHDVSPIDEWKYELVKLAKEFDIEYENESLDDHLLVI